MGWFSKNRAASQHNADAARPQLMDEKAPSPVAFIYRSELDYISRCVLDYPNIETGGQLFGFWTSQGAPVVLYAIGPGRNANHQHAFFNQDIPYLETIGNELVERYALQHIGEWHSHHQLGLASPSGHDAQTMFNGLRNIPQRRLLLCICNYRNGAATVNPYTFHEEHMTWYEDARWIVKEMDSPFRKLADTALASKLVHPRTQVAVHGDHRIVPQSRPARSDEAQKIDASYWLMRPGNADIMKQMLAFVESRWIGAEVRLQAGEGVVQLSVSHGEIVIRFPKDFPSVSPYLIIDGQLLGTSLWPGVIDETIYDAFCKWFADVEPLCCQKFVSLQQSVQSQPEPAPVSESQPAPEPQLEPVPVPEAESVPEQESESVQPEPIQEEPSEIIDNQ